MKNSKKLIISLATLVLALALTASTTFAWFTMSANPSMGGVDLTVQSGTDDLLISLDQGATPAVGSFKNTWTAQEVATALTTQLAGKKLKDITSTDGKAFTYETATNVANVADYLTFKISFRSANAYDVKLNTTSSVVAKGELPAGAPKLYAWKALTVADYGKDQAINTILDTRAANAARVSFVVGTTAKIWDPNITAGYSKGNLANDYRVAVTGGVAGTPAAAPNTVTTGTGADATTILAVTGGAVATLTVNVWLEGWDGDCLNTVLGDAFTTALNFYGVKK